MISCNVNVKNEVEKWVKQDGLLFLRKIGVKESYVLVDFGCNVGHYAIPAAKVIGDKGKVYAVDKDGEVLRKLIQTTDAEKLKNIVPIKTTGELKIDLENESVDIVLLYDILHYFTIQERTTLYKEVYRILKVNGLLSVYPKHNSSDEPLWNLSDLKLKEIISEIEGSNLYLFDEKYGELLHNDNFDKGYVLNFKKSEGI